MNANESGLTKEEKIMFSILGIIILIAISFLIIMSFSKTDRNLKEDPTNNKPTTKDKITKSQEEKEKIEIDRVDEPSSNIIEPVKLTNVTDSVTKYNVIHVSNKNDVKSENTTDQPSNDVEEIIPEVPEVPEKITWDIPSTVQTQAFAKDTVYVDNTIILSNGTTAKALVTVRKLEDDTYNIVELTDNRFVATEGIYKYYYTYENITKELQLVVKKRLENIDITLLNNATYTENNEFSQKEFDNIIKNSNGTQITKNEHVYQININQTTDTNIVALFIYLNRKIEYVNTSTPSITIGSSNHDMWNEDYENGRLRFLIRTNEIQSNVPLNIEVKCNDETYVLELLININKNIIDNENPNNGSNNNQETEDNNSPANENPSMNNPQESEANLESDQNTNESQNIEIIPSSLTELERKSLNNEQIINEKFLAEQSLPTKRVSHENIISNDTAIINELSSLRT